MASAPPPTAGWSTVLGPGRWNRCVELVKGVQCWGYAEGACKGSYRQGLVGMQEANRASMSHAESWREPPALPGKTEPLIQSCSGGGRI